MKRLALLILLVLGGYAKPAFADACLGAPMPRLHVGGEAVVAIDGLNLRALPAVETGVVVRLYHNHRLSVIGGPSCNGLYTWWRVETASGLRGWIAEGTPDQYYVVPLEDADQPPTPFEAACVLAFEPLYCL